MTQGLYEGLLELAGVGMMALIFVGAFAIVGLARRLRDYRAGQTTKDMPARHDDEDVTKQERAS